MYLGRKYLRQFPSHHILRHFFRGYLVDLFFQDKITVPENHYTIAYFLNFLEFVRNVDNRAPFLFQLAHQIEEDVDFMARKHRRGLVHDENSGFESDGLADFHHLFFRGAQRSNIGIR